MPSLGHLSTPSNPPLGDALALLSALFCESFMLHLTGHETHPYALIDAFYVLLLKMRVKDESRVDMVLFLGFVGAINVVCMWPFGFILHWTGLEVWEWPSGISVWGAILGSGALTLVSDYLYLSALLKTTPLVVTVGLSLTIPLAIVGDIVLGNETGGKIAYVGAAMVLASVLFLGLESAPERLDDVVIDDSQAIS